MVRIGYVVALCTVVIDVTVAFVDYGVRVVHGEGSLVSVLFRISSFDQKAD